MPECEAKKEASDETNDLLPNYQPKSDRRYKLPKATTLRFRRRQQQQQQTRSRIEIGGELG